MKYDDASWHHGGDFPSDLPSEAGATHISMFVAWALLKGLGGEIHVDEFPEGLEELRDRTSTPGTFFINACDQKFTDEDLNDEGNAFTEAYFAFKTGLYLTDYESTFDSDGPTLYHVADTWENFNRIAPVIDARYEEWKRGVLKTGIENPPRELVRPWWKIW